MEIIKSQTSMLGVTRMGDGDAFRNSSLSRALSYNLLNTAYLVKKVRIKASQYLRS